MKTASTKDGRQLVFRPLKLSDLKALFKWVKVMEKEDTFVLLNRKEPVSFQEERNFLKKLLAKPKQKILIGVFDGQTYVGGCSIEKLGKRQGHIGRFGIALLKAYRGQGIGSKLARYTIAQAKKKLKIKQVILSCLVINRVGLKLYQNLGFKKHGRHPRAVRYQGKLVDEVLMHKDLA